MLELWVLIKIIICMLKIYWFCGSGGLVSWMLFASCIFTQEFLMGVPISSSKEEPRSISDQEQDLGTTGLISTSQNCPKADHWRRYKMLKFAQNFLKLNAICQVSSLWKLFLLSCYHGYLGGLTPRKDMLNNWEVTARTNLLHGLRFHNWTEIIEIALGWCLWKKVLEEWRMSFNYSC